MTTAAQAMPKLEDIVGALERSMKPQLDAVNAHLTEVDTKLATVVAINERIAALEGGATKTKSDLDTAVAEIVDFRDRMKRFAQINGLGAAATLQDGAVRFDAHGQLIPSLSRGFVEWVRDAIAINQNGYREFVKRKLNRDVNDLSYFGGERDTTQLNAATTTVGGYLVPPEYRPELQKLLTAYGQARKLFRVIHMPTDKLTMPALDAEMTVYEIAENVAPTESKPTVALFTLNSTIWAGLTHIPLKLVMEANPGIVQIVVEALFRSHAKNEDVQGFTRSDGTPYFGLLYTATSGNTNSRGNANKVILGNTSGGVLNNTTKTHYSDLTFDDLRNMVDATPTPALAGAAFLMHRTQLSYLRGIAQAKPAAWYNPIFERNGSDTVPGAGTSGVEIYGYPVILIEALPAQSGAANAAKPFIAFCNPNYMAFGDQEQPTVAQDSSIGFKEGQIWVRGTEMFGVEAMVKDAITVLYTSAT